MYRLFSLVDANRFGGLCVRVRVCEDACVCGLIMMRRDLFAQVHSGCVDSRAGVGACPWPVVQPVLLVATPACLPQLDVDLLFRNTLRARAEASSSDGTVRLRFRHRSLWAVVRQVGHRGQLVLLLALDCAYSSLGHGKCISIMHTVTISDFRFTCTCFVSQVHTSVFDCD